MKTVYLHIGTMKTGTTALQEFFAVNGEALSRQDCCFPLMEIGLPHTYELRNAHFLIYRSPAETTEERRAEEQEVWRLGFERVKEAAETADRIILTDEMLWYAQNRKNFWKRVKKELKKIGCDLRVIVYLRRQDLYVESYWNQKVKGNSRLTMSFAEYLESGAYRGILPDYYEELERMSTSLGQERLIVRVYEKGQMEGEAGTIFSDFLAQLGMELTPDFLFPEKPANMQISDNFIELKRQINGLADYAETDNFYRRAMIGAYEATRPVGAENPPWTMYAPGQQETFLTQFAESNARVAEEYLGREDGILFREPIRELPQWSFQAETYVRDVMLTMAEADIYQQMKIVSLNQRLKLLENRVIELEEQNRSMYRSLIFRIYRKIREWIKGKPRG